MKQSQSQTGIGVSGLLWVTLIVLKTLGLIEMSWFWVVTGIIWIPLAILAAWIVVIGIVAFLAFLVALIASLFE